MHPTENTDPTPQPSIGWNDVVAASAAAEAERVERTRTFDRILVDLTAEERADYGTQHVAADTELEGLVEEKKEAMADFKARIAKVESRKREIAEAITKKKAWREAPTEGWICEEIFATNTRRYIDPADERVLCVEAMKPEDRQLALPTIDEQSEAKAREVDPAPPASSDLTDPEALLAAAQRGADVEPTDATLDNDGVPDSFSDLGDDDDEEDDS